MSSIDKPPYRYPDISKIKWLDDLVNEIHLNTGVDKRAILIGVLSVLSFVLMKLYKAKCPSRDAMPIVMMFLIVAGSGAGKTTLFKILIKKILAHQSKNLEFFEKKLQEYFAEIKIWQFDYKVLEKTYKMTKESGEDTSAIRQEIKLHEADKPKQPRRPVMVHNDSTVDAMLQKVIDNHVALFLASSDADSVLGKKEFEKLFPILIELKSGAGYNRARKNEGRADLAHTLITVLLMIQENVLMRALDVVGDKGREMGLWARFMFCVVPETEEDMPPLPENPDWSNLQAFEDKIQFFLEQTDKHLEDPNTPVIEVEFSLEAAEYYGQFIQWVKTQEKEHGRFSNMKDIAARMGELSAQLSVLLHAASLKEGSIDIEELKTAIDIYMAYLPDLVVVVDCEATDIRNAKKVYKWLQSDRIRRGRRYISWSKLLRTVLPKILRDGATLERVLEVLKTQNKLATFHCGKALCADLHPLAHFDENAAATELHYYESMQGVIRANPNVHYAMNIHGTLPQSGMFIHDATTLELPAMSRFVPPRNGYRKKYDDSNNPDDSFDAFLD